MTNYIEKIQKLKKYIDPYIKKFSDWYKKDDNVKKFKEVISTYIKKFYLFYKQINRNKNIILFFVGLVLIIILGRGFSGGWFNSERNTFIKGCMDGYDPNSNSGKLYKKYCACGYDNYRKGKDYATIAKCLPIIQSERFQNALKRDLGY